MGKQSPRWVTTADDLPEPGEYTARLSAMPGWTIDETRKGAGRPARSAVLTDDGRLAYVGEAAPTDLHVRRSRLVLTITSHDGRQLIAGFGPHANSPQVDADADEDLQRMAIIAWRGRPRPGRPSERSRRIQEMVAAAAALGDAATVDTVAQHLGRVTTDGERQGDYNRDVAAAGGFAEIVRLASEL